MKKLFMAALLCCTTIFAFAEAGPICDGLLGKENATSDQYVPARVKWTTDADGNVDITILPFSKAEEEGATTKTCWRGRGMADNLTAGWKMTINGESALLADYFKKSYGGEGTTVYQLMIKVGKKAELEDKTVVITRLNSGSGNICWKTPRGTNAYGAYQFEYLYGSICEDATLAAPTNVSITGNILTFDAVTGADAYAANIYFNGEMIKSIIVTPGVELTRLMNTGATFEVKVVAKSGAVESEESAAATWVVADEPLTIESSEYCDFVIGNNDNERAAMTWQTDAEGNINITISGDGATWRGTAFKGITYFWVGECPASAFFVEEYTQGSAVYTLKLKDATKKPVVGETIQFKGTYQWLTANEDNAYANVTFTYTYGSACAGLAAPTNVAVDANGVITFDAVDGADNYVVTIYNNDLPVAIYKSIAPGATLPFQAIETGTYTVTVYAQGDGAIDSDESAPFEWALTGSGYSTSQSSLCDVLFESVADPGGNYLIEDSYVELSMYTNTDNKSIIVSISPVIEGDEVSFRGDNGVELSAFTTNGVALSSYFTANNPNNQKTYTLTPKDGCSLPYGTVIHYNGTIRWNTSKHKNAYRNNVAIEYIYGSNCDQKTVSAGVNNSAMGSAVVKNGDEIVSYVPENTEVSFIATPADAQLHRFVSWTQGGVVVSTDATYTTTIDKSTNLIANFEYILYDYCRYPIVATGGAATGKKLYLSLGKKNNGEYFIRFDGSSEAPLTALNNAAYTLNSVKTEIIFGEDNLTGNNVPFNTTNGRWSFDAAGYGSAQMVFTLAEGKTTQDIYVWANTITFSTTEGDLVYVDNQYRNKLFGNPSPLRHNINWDCTTCVDTEAPILNTFHVDVLNETDLRIATQATDNWDVPLTYTISREGAEDIVLIGASGETLTYDITGLTTGTEYSFTMVVSDGINTCAAQTCTATPVADTEKPVMVSATIESSNFESAIINVSATDNKAVTGYHIVDATNGIDGVYIPEEGKIIIEGLTHGLNYNFTITAIDAAGNESNSIVVTLDIPFNSTKNLALNKPYGFGYENANNIAKHANDGNINSQWTTYGNNLGADVEWWYVDLGDIYSLNNITITWGNPTPTTYILQTRVSEPSEADKSDDAAWVTVATITDAVSNAEKSTNISSVGRYVRFHSLAKNGDCIRMNEFCVYGTGIMTELDTEKPIMVDATLVSVDSKNAVLFVEASDNIGIANFHIIDAINGIDLTMPAENGQIKLTGLTSGTTYNFTITAIDLYGNVSENDKVIEVTTSASYAIEPTTAAPIPTWPAELVMSLYSDSYDFAPAEFGTYQATWYNRPTMTRKTIDGNEYLYYDLYRDGVIGWEFSSTSIITMEKLHIDIWSSINGSIAIRPITIGGTEVRKTLTLVAGQWNSFDIDLSEFGTQDWTQLLQFGIDQYNAGGLVGDYIAIDNVYFYKAPEAVNFADDATDNSTIVANNADKFANVTINRSILANGEWFTLCLPFDMDEDKVFEVFGNSTIATLVSSEDRGSLIHLNFDYVKTIEAGKAYMIKPGKDFVVGSIIEGVTIKNVNPEDLKSTCEHMYFQGVFDQYLLTGDNKRFVGPNNYLYSPAEGGTNMKSFRCYFTIPVESQALVGSKAARIVFGPQVATGTENVQSDQVPSAKVIIDGTLYIIRDGRTYNAQGQLVK